MQKLILFLLSIAIIVLSSCSNVDFGSTMEEPSRPSESSALVLELTTFNDSIMSTRSPQSRDFWTKALRVCAVASADIAAAYEIGKIGGTVGAIAGPEGAAAGAVIGGLIGAAGGSYVAYCSTESVSSTSVTRAYMKALEENFDFSSFLPTEIDLQIPSNVKDIHAIGAKHNVIVENLITNNLSTSAPLKILSSFELSILESSDFSKGYSNTISRLLTGDVTTFVQDDGRISTQIVRNYLTVFNNYVEKSSDVELISNEYIAKVQKSIELQEYEKNLIYSAICVAASSFELWYSKF